MGRIRAIRGYFIPVVVLCSVFGGAVGGSVAVGAVSGGVTQSDRLHTIGMGDDPVHGSPGTLSGSVRSAPPDRPRGPAEVSFSSTETTDRIVLEAVTTGSVPGSEFEDVQTVTDVSTLTTETETVASEDVLVLEVTSAGLSNALTASDTDPNARLLELVQSGVLEVQIANSASNTTLDLSATDEAGGLRVIPEAEGSDVNLLIDTERTVFEANTTGVTAGELDVEIDSQETDEPVSESVSVTPREASFETGSDGKISLTADSNRTITGDTTVAPNTNLTIHIRSNEEATFNITRTARVSEDGSFSFRVDFGNVTKGTQFEMLIPDEGFSEEATTQGVLTATSTASIQLTAQQFESDDSQTVTVKSANLSEGGFLVVYNQSFLTQNRSEAQESYQGVSEYRQPGSHSDVEIPLDGDYEGEGTVIVVPYIDTNDNEEYDSHNASIDGPYRGADDGAIIAVANASSTTDSDGHSSAGQHSGPSLTGGDSTDTSASSHDDHTETSAEALNDDPGTERTAQGTTSEGPSNDQLSDVDGPGFGPMTGLLAVGITALLVALGRRP